MTKILTVSLLLGALTLNTVQADQCYALALSSGDMSAAYQVGALSGLIKTLPAEQVGYQSISGVAGGAINAAILSSFPIGQEQAAL